MSRVLAASLIACAALGVLAGCEPYRVEYRKRPSYYRNAAMGDMPDRVVLDDGTVLVFTEETHGTLGRAEDGEAFQMREEHEDGTITLRAILPEHVLANTYQCLANQEYDLLYEQMLSQQTRDAYEQRGQGVKEFAEFLATHRRDLMALLNRMLLGMPRHDVIMTPAPAGGITMELAPSARGNFKFRYVDLASEGEGLRLRLIR